MSNDANEKYIWLYPGVLFTLMAVIFLSIFMFPLRINDNSALLLISAKFLWEGKIPYVDFIQLDPPMILYVKAFPAAIAELTSNNIILVFLLFVAFMTVYTLVYMFKLFKDSGLNYPKTQIYTIAIFFVVYSLWVFQKNDWGQRDHLFALVLIPYLILRFIRDENGKASNFHAIIIGIMVGIGASFKHYFVIILLANELYYIIKNRTVKVLNVPEIYAMISIFILYAIHIFFIPTEMREVYFNKWLPMLNENYHRWDRSYWEVLHVWRYYFSTLAIGITLAVVFYSQFITKISRFLPPLIISTLAAFIVYFIQKKGFLYQIDPVLGVFSIIAGILYIEMTQRVNLLVKSTVNGVLAISSLAAIVYMFFLLAKPKENPIEQMILQHTRPNEGILILSPTVFDPYPTLLQLGRNPGSRYITNFPLSFFPKNIDYAQSSSYLSRNELSKIEQEYIQDLLIDVHNNPPALILIKNTNDCQGCPKNFNIYEYLKKNGFLYEISKNYKQQKDIKDFAVFIYDKPISN